MSAASSKVAWLREPLPAIAQANDPPLSMLLPIIVLAAATIYFGIDTEWSVGHRRRRPPRPCSGGCDDGSAIVRAPRCSLAVLTPFVGALLIPLFHKLPNLRETVTLATAGMLCLRAFGLLGPVLDGARPGAR